MSQIAFERVIVPVATPDDAATTAAALTASLVESSSAIIPVFIVEKAGGAPDKASVEQRELVAEDAFARFADAFAVPDATLETQIRYGSAVAATIVETAHDVEADAIAFTPRGSNRWQKLLTGDVTHGLVADSDVPVLVLPDPSSMEGTRREE